MDRYRLMARTTYRLVIRDKGYRDEARLKARALGGLNETQFHVK